MTEAVNQMWFPCEKWETDLVTAHDAVLQASETTNGKPGAGDRPGWPWAG